MARDQLIQVRRDLAANWVSAQTTAGATPVLAAGEIAFETDTKKFKIGDGTTVWGSLAYAPAGVTYSSGTNAVVDRAGNIGSGATGDLLYQSAADTTAKLNIGTANKLLAVNSGATAPTWITPTVSTTYFASTTSAELAAVLSNETGTGVVVFNNTPTLITPAIQSGGATFAGSTSGTTTLKASATASGVLTLPATTDTVLVSADIATYFKQDSTGNFIDLGYSGSQNRGIKTGTSGTGGVVSLTLPSSTGTLALTTVVSGYLKADATVPMTGVLNIGGAGSADQLTVSAGTVTFPAAGGTVVVKATADSDYVRTSSVTQTVAGAKTFSGATVVSGALTASSTVTLSGITSAGDALVKINPTGGALSSGKASLTADVSGLLPVANGGFGVNPANNATDLATARGVLRIFVSATAPASPAVGDLWFW